MPKYSFTFKKDDVFVEFSTEDKGVVEKQFQLWVADADEHERSMVKQSKVDFKKEAAKASEPLKSAKDDEKTEVVAESKVETPEVFDKASTLLKSINDIQSVDSESSTLSEKTEKETAKFEEILDKSIDNPTFEPVKPKDKVFLNLVNNKNTSDKFNHLIIVAYYLSEFEKMERFSLKQVNAKLMQNLSEVIDHTTLQEAINKNYIELVPDLTGVSEVGEYRLTRLGEEFFAKI